LDCLEYLLPMWLPYL